MRRIPSGDVQLALFEQGDPANPTVVLVHGYPDTSRVWDEVVALLKDRFHVVTYDVRGQGESSAPADKRAYDFASLVDDMENVFDAVAPGKSVHLVAHDWGSIQSWEAVTGRLESRIATFTSFGGPSLDHAGNFLRYGPKRKAAGQLARSWYIGMFQFPFAAEMAVRAAPKVLPRLLKLAEGISPRPGHPADSFASDLLNGIQLYRVNMMRRVTGPRENPTTDLPVQLIEPTRDIFVSPDLLASIKGWVPNLWHRKVTAGHWVQRSHPELIARWITEFVDHVDGGRPPTRSLRRAQVATSRKAYEDHLVVVTGAGSGIGRATARAFASHGAEVICADIDEAAAQRTADQITKKYGTAHGYRLDVSDGDAMETFAAAVRDDHGVPDIVVNNAGIAVSGGFLDHTTEDWRRTLDVNLWGVIHGCRLFGQQMVDRGEGGHIVNIASLAAFVPTRMLPAYSTSKAAVKMLSDCLRADLAGDGIGVTAICPGFIATAIGRNAHYAGQDAATEAEYRQIADKALDRRGYPPERVAAHILRAVHNNEAVVPVNAEGHLGYAMSRISPAATRAFSRRSGRTEDLTRLGRRL